MFFVRDMKNCGDAKMNKLSFFIKKAYFFNALFRYNKINIFRQIWYAPIEKCSNYKNLSKLFRDYVLYARYEGLRRLRNERIQKI